MAGGSQASGGLSDRAPSLYEVLPTQNNSAPIVYGVC
jgi:hypothetical protein